MTLLLVTLVGPPPWCPSVSQVRRRCPAMPSSPGASRCLRQGGAQLCPPHGDTGEEVQSHVLLPWCLTVSQEEEVPSHVITAGHTHSLVFYS